MKPFHCPNAVMRNEAQPADWQEVDRVPPAQALAWVEAVLGANGCGRVEEELVWWAAELTVLRG